MSLDQQVHSTITRWLAAARVRDGVPTWVASLGYMASCTHYHATTINGFVGDEKDWLRHLVENVPDEPFPGLRQELEAQLDSGALSLRSEPVIEVPATPLSSTPQSAPPTVEVPSATAKVDSQEDDALDAWLAAL